MPTLTELQDQRGQLVTEARSALEAITANTDDARTTELEQRHDTIMGQLDKLDATIKREERVAAAEKSQEERQRQRRPLGADAEATTGGNTEAGTQEQREAEYRTAFLALARTGFDASELSTEQRAIIRRGYDSEIRTQVSGTATAGGYTVPVILANEIVKSMRDWGPMFDGTIVGEINTGTGNEFDIPTNDDTGNTAAALAEGADLVDDNSGDLVFGQKRLDAFVYATPWIKLAFELMQDSAFNLEAFLGTALGERLGRLANAKLTVGNGAGQPNGIVTASSLGKTTASATAFTADEVIDLLHSVNAAYRRNPKARFMFADTTLATLRKLKDGQGNFLWQMGDVTKAQPAMLLDHPYSVNDDVPAVATGNKAIIFGDFSRYWVRKVGGPLIGTVRERFWPKVGMAGLIRFDGELADAAAVKHLKLA